MSEQLFDNAVRNWLEDGSDRTPPTAIDAVLLAVKTTPQERDLRIPWRFPTVNPLARIAVLATIAVVAVGTGLYLMQPAARSQVGGQPSPTAAALPSTPAAARTPATQVPPIADGSYVGRAVKISDIIASINSTSWLSSTEKASLLTTPFAQSDKSTFTMSFELNQGTFSMSESVDGETPRLDLRASATFPDASTLLIQENILGGPITNRLTITKQGDGFSLTLGTLETPNMSAEERFVYQLYFESAPFSRQP